MNKYDLHGWPLDELIDRAESGSSADVDFVMSNLSKESTFAMTRYVDFALGLVTTTEGFERIIYYLFNGTQIQRNYASLYLNRLGERSYVKEAFDKGLIDEIQAFAR